MVEGLIIAGAGGQGIMLLGKVLAEAAMRQNKFVTWFPSYGAEVRGGTACCMVVISDAEIGSPCINKADTLIIMNEPSRQRFKNRIKNKGLCLVNSSLAGVTGERRGILAYPFSDIALKLGNIKVANMVALGCYMAQRKIVSQKIIEGVICDFAGQDKKELIEINKKALIAGLELKP